MNANVARAQDSATVRKCKIFRSDPVFLVPTMSMNKTCPDLQVEIVVGFRHTLSLVNRSDSAAAIYFLRTRPRATSLRNTKKSAVRSILQPTDSYLFCQNFEFAVARHEFRPSKLRQRGRKCIGIGYPLRRFKNRGLSDQLEIVRHRN